MGWFEDLFIEEAKHALNRHSGSGSGYDPEVNYGAENAGKLLYVGDDGKVTVLTLGTGLKIVNGVLTITSAAVTAAICGESTICGNTICGGV
jgi:hypothetical protein